MVLLWAGRFLMSEVRLYRARYLGPTRGRAAWGGWAGTTQKVLGIFPESQGQNLVLTVVHLPYSLLTAVRGKVPGPHSKSRNLGRSGGNCGEWHARSVLSEEGTP